MGSYAFLMFLLLYHIHLVMCTFQESRKDLTFLRVYAIDVDEADEVTASSTSGSFPNNLEK